MTASAPIVGTVAAQAVARLVALFDPGSLRLEPTATDAGVVCGIGRIRGIPSHAFSCDGAIAGGALGVVGCSIIVQTLRQAVKLGQPVVGVWHSGGARLQDGTAGLSGVGRIFREIVLSAGRVPMVSVVLGPAAGGAAYGPALTDFVVCGPAARIFVTGPDIVQQVTGELVDARALGGPELHATQSGLVHAVAPSDPEALHVARDLVVLLGGGCVDENDLPALDTRMRSLLPPSPRLTYDVRAVADLLLDVSPRLELQPRWAQNVRTFLGRLHGRPVGVVANNPAFLAGCLDWSGSEKAAGFVEKCDALGVPLVVLADVPGYLPGTEQERAGVVQRGSRLLRAFAGASVPRVTVILRKAYGGAFIAMNSRSLGATAVLAWPSAEVGVMYARSAVEIVHRRLLAAEPPELRAGTVARLVRQYERESGSLDRALESGDVDEVIDPATTRRRVYAALVDHPLAAGPVDPLPIARRR